MVYIWAAVAAYVKTTFLHIARDVKRDKLHAGTTLNHHTRDVKPKKLHLKNLVFRVFQL